MDDVVNKENNEGKIKKYRQEIEENYLEPLQSDELKGRIHKKEKMRERNAEEGAYQRDYARIMYSSSFRRLQGKMQLLGIQNDQFFRNRLTHSLEVAQIARSIALTCGYKNQELYIVEAGALAHDIGNPPFGHAGERHLNELFINCGGFEGNAQTLRILTNVERKRPDFRGLNLSYRTLLSVVKYFKKADIRYKQSTNSKFIYDDDYELLKKFIDENNVKIRTFDVQIVDIADEIAYAAHDLEDGLRVKAFTIDEILQDFYVKYKQSASFEKLCELVQKAKERSGFTNPKTDIDSSQVSRLFRQELTSSIINVAINDIGLVDVSDEKKNKTGTVYEKELGFVQYGELIEGLKDIVFSCINHNDSVYHYERRGEKVLSFLKDHFSENTKYLPPEYRKEVLKKQYPDLSDYDDDFLKNRLICDYIAGMMDSYAIATYEKFSGNKF